jgi:hypothetical protein
MNEKPQLKFRELWKQVDFTKLSTLSLVFSNLLVILFAIVDNLSAREVLWMYWIQSVIIGLFNFIKILSLKEFSTEGFKQGNKSVPNTKAAKISTAIFFLFHYGFFHLIYAMFLGVFSDFSNASSGGTGIAYLFISALTFLVSYTIEFINSKKEEPTELPNLGFLMFAPYARIIPMHLTIILGGFIGATGSFFSADTNLVIIVLFTSIKTIVDLITHSVDLSKHIKKKATVTDL